MDNCCPSCNRAFRGISDYPMVKLVKFQRIPIPEGVIFPDRDSQSYMGPRTRCGGPKAPQDVLDFFRNNPRANTYQNVGLTWDKRGGNWDDAVYRLTRDNARDIILEQLNPYFDKLEWFEGREIETEHALPGFMRGEIPNTSYELNLIEKDERFGWQMLTQSKLVTPKLETTPPVRELALVIAHCDGGTLSVVKHLAMVGGLAYEGMLLDSVRKV